jgi:hypothetical protein
VRVSYPAAHRRRDGDTVVQRVVLRDFRPTRELELRW